MKIIICGFYGKMGQNVLQAVSSNQDIEVVAGIDAFKKPNNCTAITVYENFQACDKKCHVIIDFSLPTSLSDLLEFAIKNHCNVVLATTGYSDEQKAEIAKASKYIAIFQSANMSIGVNLLSNLIKQSAKFLGEDFDIEIIEKHHNQKIDSPSGTALMLADSASSAFDDGKDYIYDRKSIKAKRQKNEIGISSVRGGTIVGEHDVLFIGNDEIITLSHTANSRQIFARGAIKAALFIKDKKCGKFDMNDIIEGIKNNQ